LTCYDNDGGDCGFVCGDGYCDYVQYEDENNCPEDCSESETCETCEYNYTNYGSECCDSAWYEYGIDCITLEYNYNWDCSGCTCPGDEDSFCGDGYCIGDETASNCPVDCDIGPCSDGYLLDCSGDADCCPESWLGDGYGDCEDQEWGCDLTCYDNDGGDCDQSCQQFECEDGSCVENETDCPDLNCDGQLIEIIINSENPANISWILEEEVDAYQGWFSELLVGDSNGQVYCDLENHHSLLFSISNDNDGICCNGENRSYDVLIDGCSMIDVLDPYAYEFNPEYDNFNGNEYMALFFESQGNDLSQGNNLVLLNFNETDNVIQDCLYEFYFKPVNGNYMDYEWGTFNGDQLYCDNPVSACIGIYENNLIANFNDDVEFITFKHNGCINGYTGVELASFNQKEKLFFDWWGEDNDGDCYENDLDNCPDEYNAYQSNYDGDSQGDICDFDDDNDGVIDGQDCNPYDFTSSEYDCCGVCGGDNSQCTNCCGSPFYNDCSDDCYIDSNGDCCYALEVDTCDICEGNDTTCIDLGDINGDSTINVIDIVLAVELILNGSYDIIGDLNEDGLLNVIDIVLLVDLILNP